ncbi:ABC transporter F family member 4-like [Ambystoma mexicanum]|uniref:ABC transporter F family member 4-like n=1 Tax=Ambystoma mexicanum TaxID=8296 RepID=UPI0037E861D0
MEDERGLQSPLQTEQHSLLEKSGDGPKKQEKDNQRSRFLAWINESPSGRWSPPLSRSRRRLSLACHLPNIKEEDPQNLEMNESDANSIQTLIPTLEDDPLIKHELERFFILCPPPDGRKRPKSNDCCNLEDITWPLAEQAAVAKKNIPEANSNKANTKEQLWKVEEIEEGEVLNQTLYSRRLYPRSGMKKHHRTKCKTEDKSVQVPECTGSAEEKLQCQKQEKAQPEDGTETCQIAYPKKKEPIVAAGQPLKPKTNNLWSTIMKMLSCDPFIKVRGDSCYTEDLPSPILEVQVAEDLALEWQEHSRRLRRTRLSKVRQKRLKESSIHALSTTETKPQETQTDMKDNETAFIDTEHVTHPAPEVPLTAAKEGKYASDEEESKDEFEEIEVETQEDEEEEELGQLHEEMMQEEFAKVEREQHAQEATRKHTDEWEENAAATANKKDLGPCFKLRHMLSCICDPCSPKEAEDRSRRRSWWCQLQGANRVAPV